MKLLLAIVNNDDSALASSALTDAGYSVTKLSTTGGFLMVGNTTLLIGTEDDKTQGAIDILKRYCTTRKQMVSSSTPVKSGDPVSTKTCVLPYSLMGARSTFPPSKCIIS